MSGNLERMWNFSFLLLLLSFSSHFSLSFQFSSPPLNCLVQQVKWDVLSCHVLPFHWLSWITRYPLIQNFIFPSSQVVTHVQHGSHLDFCLICSPFDTWLIVSHPNKCQVSLATFGASKNMKFRLSRNSTKFYGITRFCETIPTVKSVSSYEI